MSTLTHSIDVGDTRRYSSDFSTAYHWDTVSELEAVSSDYDFNCFGMSGSVYNAALIPIPAFGFAGVAEKLSFSFKGYYREAHTFYWALCTSMDNRNKYKGTRSAVEDATQIASGTFTLGTSTSSSSKTYGFEIEASIPAETPLYLYLWAYETGSYAVHINTSQTFDVTLSYMSGLVYIDTGSGLEPYQPYIDNGTGWDLCQPYIDNGNGWDLMA